MSFFLFAALTFILIGRPQDVFQELEPLRLAFVLTLITLVATVLGPKSFFKKALFIYPESKKYNLFYFIMIASIPFAYYRGSAFSFVFYTYLANIIYFYLFLTHVDSLHKLNRIIMVICYGALFYSIFSLVKGSFSNGRFSFGGMYDPNDLAFILVSLLPLSLVPIMYGKSWIKKIAGSGSIAISLLVILMTGSRSGLLGLLAIFTIFLFAKSSRIRLPVKILLVFVASTVILLSAGKINTERYMTITEIGSDYNVKDEYGRFEIWKRGIKILATHPLTGVGATCFSNVIGDQREAEGLRPVWQVAHNSYIQVASELGVIGFILFFSLIASTIENFRKAANVDLSGRDALHFRIIVKYIQIGFIGCLITSFFLSQAYSILFTLFFAFSASLRRIQPAEANVPAVRIVTVHAMK